MIKPIEIQAAVVCSRDEAEAIHHALNRTARIHDWPGVAEKLRDMAAVIESRAMGTNLQEYQEFRDRVLSAMWPASRV